MLTLRQGHGNGVVGQAVVDLLSLRGEAVLLRHGELELLLHLPMGPFLLLQELLGQQLPLVSVSYDLPFLLPLIDVSQEGDGPASLAGLADVAPQGFCEGLLESPVGVLWVLLPDLLPSLLLYELVGLMGMKALVDGPEPDLLGQVGSGHQSGLVMGEVVLEVGMSPADLLVEVLDGLLRDVLVGDGVRILVEDELG